MLLCAQKRRRIGFIPTLIAAVGIPAKRAITTCSESQIPASDENSGRSQFLKGTIFCAPCKGRASPVGGSFPPGNCRSSRKQPGRSRRVTAADEALWCKRPLLAVSEHTGHNMSEHRASLEIRNVNAELVKFMRRPPSVREASDKRTGQDHRGIGDGMCAKETRVNTGDPSRWGSNPQLDAREGESRPVRESERLVVAMKRLITVERRSLGSRATKKRARVRRLA